MYFRLKEKQAINEKRTARRRENEDLPALVPSSKRLKHSEEGSSSVATDKRHRTQDSSLNHRKSKREGDRMSKTEPQKYVDKSSKKKKSKEKKADEVTRETNWLSSNLRVRIVDQDYKKGRFYNTKVTYILECRVYFRILLKRGQTHRSKLQWGGGANTNPSGGNPILNIGEANFQGGANQTQGGAESTPPRNKPCNILC
jgi:hypothetical protein